MEEFRSCIECRTWKPRADFSVRGVWDGVVRYHHRCDTCQTARVAAGTAGSDPMVIRVRRQHLGVKYGITLEEYDALFEAQGGVCAVCRRPETAIGNGGMPMRLAVDHDHVTGRVRGLLCQACNRAAGLFREDIAVMERAIEYLERFEAEVLVDGG